MNINTLAQLLAISGVGVCLGAVPVCSPTRTLPPRWRRHPDQLSRPSHVRGTNRSLQRWYSDR